MGIIALLVVIGLVLLFVETLLPGLIVGALGMLSLAAGVVYAYVEFGARTGNATLFLVLILLCIALVLWVKYFPDSPVARAFVLNQKIGTIGAEKPDLIGQSGVALTPLRPAGTAVFGGIRVDVVADGSYINRGTKVRVTAVEGSRVVVREVEST